jgi:hypothetical protein
MDEMKEGTVKLNEVVISVSELEDLKKDKNIRIIQESPDSYRKLTRFTE